MARVGHANYAASLSVTLTSAAIGIHDNLSLSWIGSACVEAAFLGSCDAVFATCRTTIIAVVARAGHVQPCRCRSAGTRRDRAACPALLPPRHAATGDASHRMRLVAAGATLNALSDDPEFLQPLIGFF
jgi:hypothetical protein